MYKIEDKEGITTRLCWHARHKAFVYGTSSGLMVSAYSAGSADVEIVENGLPSCLAVNGEGKRCAIAVDDVLSERDAISAEKLTESRLNGKRMDMPITHVQYDSNGSHL
jgi:hypothetical protein